MDQKTVEQLVKILALVDSSHEGEAAVAVRKAREILEREGLCLADLGRTALSPKSRPLSFSLRPSQHIQLQLNELRQRLDHLEAEARMLNAQAELWRRRAAELEQTLGQRKAETERWRQLAHDTVEKLWDMGRVTLKNEALMPKH